MLSTALDAQLYLSVSQMCLTACMHLSVCYFTLSKEQTGEKTNNGTHYKLQLLYSNGKSNMSSELDSLTLCLI